MFVVNGTGVASKFGASEVMRIQNGRVGIGTTAPATLVQVGAAPCNGTTWVNSSDRNAKEKIEPVNAAAVLAKVAALPLSQWSYKVDSERHIGPMACSAGGHSGLEPETGDRCCPTQVGTRAQGRGDSANAGAPCRVGKNLAAKSVIKTRSNPNSNHENRTQTGRRVVAARNAEL